MIRERSKRRIELDPEAIGARIRSARRSRNWSRSDLAERMGVKADTITLWETGWRTPRGVTLVTLAAHLRRSIEWLLVGLPRNGKLWNLLVDSVQKDADCFADGRSPFPPGLPTLGGILTPGDDLQEACGGDLVVSPAARPGENGEGT